MPHFVTHLEGAIDGARLDPNVAHTLHKDRPIWVRYDLDAVRRAVTPADLQSRPPTLWRYRELLPPKDDASIVSLGEGMTTILRCPRLGQAIGLDNLWIKDESQLPTGSFKSRGQTVAISMCKQFGVKRVAIPTAGNAGGAMAAYAARAGMEAYVFMPADTPVINQFEAALCGAKVFLVDGLINDCGKIVRAGTAAMQWFDISTLKEPYRIEGKKTMGLELAEQSGWTLPDVILYPTGGGTGLVGMWKAFAELRELGWLKSDKLPRMVSVQSDGCAPIVRAFESGSRFANLFPNAKTIASGLRVPVAVGDFIILDAIRESGGTAIAVEDGKITEWMQLACGAEGIAVCPESAACVGAAIKLKESGWIRPDEKVLLFNCGAAQKYPHTLKLDLPRIADPAKVDWDWVSRA
ncbi:threonine synthase [Humisphaera borealis]|uniref:Threonine synthase n=1 Tax=Humisphaera borealis TaxID=2807512 RepID=A0A7M2WTJ2_9BACT|nr:threonine synthase [Humisphaera borealis]QOV88763.1 threonine synthase [Humisphaera borealis]